MTRLWTEQLRDYSLILGRGEGILLYHNILTTPELTNCAVQWILGTFSLRMN